MNQLQMINRMLWGGDNPPILQLLGNTVGNSDSAWIDTSSYNTNATQSNALYRPVLTNDLFGIGNKGYLFNGLNSHFFVPDSDRFTFSDMNGDLPFTIEFSFKLTTIKTVQWFICKRDGTTSNIEWNCFYSYPTMVIQLYSNSSVENYIAIQHSIIFELDRIYRIKYTYNGNRTKEGLSMYIDGVSVGTTRSIGTYIKMTNTNSKITIGAPGFSFSASVTC